MQLYSFPFLCKGIFAFGRMHIPSAGQDFQVVSGRHALFKLWMGSGSKAQPDLPKIFLHVGRLGFFRRLAYRRERSGVLARALR